MAWVQHAQEIDVLNLKLRHAEKQSNELAAGLDLGAVKKRCQGLKECPQWNLESALVFSFTISWSFWHHIWAIFCFAFSALGSSKANASLAELRLGLGWTYWLLQDGLPFGDLMHVASWGVLCTWSANSGLHKDRPARSIRCQNADAVCVDRTEG